MKSRNKVKISNLLLYFLFIMFFFSCEKDDSTIRRDLLISTSWSMTNNAGFTVSNEEYCILTFSANGRMTETPAVWMNYSSWNLRNDGQILVLGNDEYEIKKLTDSELTIRYNTFSGYTYSFKALSSNQATTDGVSALSKTSAKIHGSVRTDISSTVVSFEYGISTSYGQAVQVTNNLACGILNNRITAVLNGLNPETLYHYRIKAVNSTGTYYGHDLTFRTFNEQTIDDLDGNTYNSVTIGSQVWLTENLKVTKYNDVSPIPLVTDNTTWNEMITSGFCWYNNDYETNKDTFGALYNWYAVYTNNICPSGWHVPDLTEWNTLAEYLGENSGSKIRETVINQCGLDAIFTTNESGFSGLPGVWRTDYDTFSHFGDAGPWWTLTSDNPLSSWYFYVSGNDLTNSVMVKNYGMSVRCIKD